MLVRPLYCFFTIFIFYSVYMPTEPLAAHTHRGHLFSGTAGYIESTVPPPGLPGELERQSSS